jgi:hypothetical protein
MAAVTGDASLFSVSRVRNVTGSSGGVLAPKAHSVPCLKLSEGKQRSLKALSAGTHSCCFSANEWNSLVEASAVRGVHAYQLRINKVQNPNPFAAPADFDNRKPQPKDKRTYDRLFVGSYTCALVSIFGFAAAFTSQDTNKFWKSTAQNVVALSFLVVAVVSCIGARKRMRKLQFVQAILLAAATYGMHAFNGIYTHANLPANYVMCSLLEMLMGVMAISALLCAILPRRISKALHE